MKPDNVGTWALMCAVNDHYQTGMKFTYKVNQCAAKDAVLGGNTIRKYYIGIKEVDWDYAPNNMQLTSGDTLNNDTE